MGERGTAGDRDDLFWLLATGGSAAACVFITAWAHYLDFSTAFTFILAIPAILAAFRFLWKGVAFAVTLCLLSLVVMAGIRPEGLVLPLVQAVLTVWLAAVVAYLAGNLRQEEERYRSIFENAEAGACLLDGETGTILDANGRFARWLGVTVAECRGAPMARFWAEPRDLEDVITGVRESGGITDREAGFRDAAGALKWGLVSASRLPDGRLLLTVADISATKKAVADLREYQDHLEEMVERRTRELHETNVRLTAEVAERERVELALREREGQLRAIVDAAISVAYVVSDVQGEESRIQDFSPGAEHIFGHRREEVAGTPVSLLSSPRERPRLHAALAAMQRRDVEVSGEFTLVRKSGEEFPALFSLYPLVDAGGKVSRALHVAVDITAIKRAEAQIRASLQEKETLLREIHHRVKNNMQVVSALLALQEKNIRDPATLEIFRESENRIRAMALIHERLYAAGDIGHVNLEEYLGRLADFLLQSYRVSQSAVRLEIRAPGIHLDPDTAIPCGLIINELLTNALKYAFPDGRAGEIAITVEQAEPGMYRLTFRDNGVGLPEGVDPLTTKTLGLQLVHGLAVNQLAGSLEVLRGGGAAYVITFPAAR